MRRERGFKFLLLVFLFLWGCGPEEAPVEMPPAPEIKLSNGQTVEEVIAMLGEPTGRAQGLESVCCFYEGGGLEFKEGVLFGLTSELEEKIIDGAAERRRRAELKQKTVTQWWAVFRERREARKATNPLFESSSKSRKTSRSADSVHESLLVPDTVTVIYFYATWCQGCESYAPIIQGLVRNHEGVALRRVNVGSRESSEVWLRYDLRGVPSVRVFDRKGRMVGGTAHRPDEVDANIERATRTFRWWNPFQKFHSLGEKISEFFPKMTPQ